MPEDETVVANNKLRYLPFNVVQSCLWGGRWEGDGERKRERLDSNCPWTAWIQDKMNLMEATRPIVFYKITM